MREYGLIGVAGAFGAFLRYILGVFIQSEWASSFPLVTLLINYGGCLTLGLLITWAAFPSSMERAIGTGLIGSFTTFSAFSVEVINFMQQHSWFQAVLYILLSLFGGLLFAWLGATVGGRWRDK